MDGAKYSIRKMRLYTGNENCLWVSEKWMDYRTYFPNHKSWLFFYVKKQVNLLYNFPEIQENVFQFV